MNRKLVIENGTVRVESNAHVPWHQRRFIEYDGSLKATRLEDNTCIGNDLGWGVVVTILGTLLYATFFGG